MSPHCSAIFLQHSRSADVIAAPGNTQAETGSAANISARAETPTLVNSFNITSLSTADTKTQQAGKGFTILQSRDLGTLGERTGSSRNTGKVEGTVTGRSDVICVKLLIVKSLTSMRRLDKERSNQLNYVPNLFSYLYRKPASLVAFLRFNRFACVACFNPVEPNSEVNGLHGHQAKPSKILGERIRTEGDFAEPILYAKTHTRQQSSI
jgi:hypothetical protein